MSQMKIAGAALVALALGGCESWSIIMSSKIEPAAAQGEWSAVIPLTEAATWSGLFGRNEEAAQFADYCLSGAQIKTMTDEGVAPAVLAALGGAAWDLAVDAVNDKVERIQEQSSRTWNASWTTTGATLAATRCMALVRYRPVGDEKRPGYDPQMAILLASRSFDPAKKDLAAVQFAPLFVASKSSAALTKDEGDGKGRIGLSIAGAVSYFVDGKLVDSAPDAISVSGVEVWAAQTDPALRVKAVGRAAVDAKGQYDMSGLTLSRPVAYPTTGNLYIKFAVVETGTLSGKDAQAKSEIKAVADALGPVAKEALKKRLGVDDGK